MALHCTLLLKTTSFWWSSAWNNEFNFSNFHVWSSSLEHFNSWKRERERERQRERQRETEREREQFQGLNASDQISWSATSTLPLRQADKLHTLQILYFIKLYFVKIYSTFRFCCNLWKRSTLGTFVRKLVPQIPSSNVKDYKICVTKNELFWNIP